MLSRYSVCFAGLVLATASVRAQVPASERIPITDPDRLVLMGFPRDAKNVFVRKGALGTRDAGVEKLSKSWGNQEGYATVFPYELQGYYENQEGLYRTLNETFLFGTDNGNSTHGHIRIDVPNGALLAQLRFWGQDTSSPEDLVFSLYETCQAPNAEDPIYTLLGQGQSAGNYGSFYGVASLGNTTANNADCGYSAQVLIPINGVSGTLSIRKLQVVWVRQVSPAPSAATFADVPIGDSRFRYVEALATEGEFFSTFAGSPVAAVAGLAVLDVIDDEGLVERAGQMGEELLHRLREATRGCSAVRAVRGHLEAHRRLEGVGVEPDQPVQVRGEGGDVVDPAGDGHGAILAPITRRRPASRRGIPPPRTGARWRHRARPGR